LGEIHHQIYIQGHQFQFLVTSTLNHKIRNHSVISIRYKILFLVALLYFLSSFS
jgi:hypothetical protein